jgi:hypothetical protein
MPRVNNFDHKQRLLISSALYQLADTYDHEGEQIAMIKCASS